MYTYTTYIYIYIYMHIRIYPCLWIFPARIDVSKLEESGSLRGSMCASLYAQSPY